MKKLAASLLAAVGVGMLAQSPGDCGIADTPSSAVALKGLKSVNLVVNVTKDARNGLKSAGYNSSALVTELTNIAKKKLTRLGLRFDTVGAGSKNEVDSKLSIIVDTNLSTGEFDEVLRLEELVSVVRSPATRVYLTTWSRSQAPRGNETPSIKTNTVDLLDQFEGDYLDANGIGSGSGK